MRIINFGSLNIDHVYRLANFVQPGETKASDSYNKFVGGKGLNQSIAIARAGAEVIHCGCIGQDGELLKTTLAEEGVNTEFVFSTEQPSGHAIIQVNDSGENCILLHSGANFALSKVQIDKAILQADSNDWVLLQNETNLSRYIIEQAAQHKLKVVLNPAPMTSAVLEYPLDKLAYLIVNQSEAQQLSQCQQPTEILDCLSQRYPRCQIILTLAEQGVMYRYAKKQFHLPAVAVKAVDTTGAGDTFIGYFLAAMAQQQTLKVSLQQACIAAAFCVQQPGAAAAIPLKHQL